MHANDNCFTEEKTFQAVIKRFLTGLQTLIET